MHPEDVLPSWLQARYPTARVVTELPADLVGSLPVIQVVGIGGRHEGHAWNGSPADFASPNVDLDIFAATRSDARDLAMQIHKDLLTVLPGQTVNGAGVLEVVSILSPLWTPYDNTNVRRFTFTVSLRLKK